MAGVPPRRRPPRLRRLPAARRRPRPRCSGRVLPRSHADCLGSRHAPRAGDAHLAGQRRLGRRLGYDAAALDRVNRDAVAFLRGLGQEFPGLQVTVSGNLGPRGDGYSPDELLAPADAAAYHRAQIESFAAAGADRVTMLTATHVGEAIGVVLAGAAAGLPVVVAFTVETDGRLPSGQPLHEAVNEVDAATGAAALHFGVNCAHPDHFSGALDADPAATSRIGLLRANASRASHAELDEAEELDDGDPVELAGLYAQLRDRHPHLQVLGGCCGTDARHVLAIAQACVATA